MLAPAAAKSLRGGATGTYTSSGALLTAARAALCERGAFVEHHVLLPGAPSLIRHACVLSLSLCERGAFVEHHVLLPGAPSLIRHACVLSLSLCERGAFVEHHVLCPVPSLIRHACVLSHACFLMHF